MNIRLRKIQWYLQDHARGIVGTCIVAVFWLVVLVAWTSGG
jgi:hypothetical protein